MKADVLSLPYQRIWATALICSLVVGVPILFFVDKRPWLMALPIALGTLFLVGWEIYNSRPRARQLTLAMPAEFLGLSHYKGHVAFSLENPKTPAVTDQAVFDFLGEKRPKVATAPMFVPDVQGNEMCVIDSEVFINALSARMQKDTDKAFELLLKRVLQRYGEMNSISTELDEFLRAKSVLDVIRSDFRSDSNLIVTKCGESLIRDSIKAALEKRAEQQKQKQEIDFQLTGAGQSARKRK